MNTLIIIGLIVISIASAVLAERQRRRAEATQSTLDQVLKRTSEQRRMAYDDGLTTGLKRGYAEMYLAVIKAHQQGRDPIAAARRVAQMNADYLLEEPSIVAEAR